MPKFSTDYSFAAMKRERQVRAMRKELRGLTGLHSTLAGEVAQLGLEIADLKERLKQLEEEPLSPGHRAAAPRSPVLAGAR